MQVTTTAALAGPLVGAMNFLNEAAQRYPSAISFAPGRPPERFFDLERTFGAVARFVDHVARATGRPPDDVLRGLGQYGRTNGIIGDLIARHLATDEGIRVDPDAVVVTSGAQEAMAILLQALFDPARDALLVSDPTYVGITGAAAILGVPVYPVRCGDDGVDLDALVARLAEVRAAGRRPRAFYDIPDFHNPLGTTLPLAARRRLLALAREHDLLLFEDNPYGSFAYDDRPLPTLKSLDQTGNVLYLGTFSKTLCPGLRLGFVVADQRVAGDAGQSRPLADELSKVKSMLTVNTSPILQAMVGGTLLEHDFSLVALNQPKLAFLRDNRDRMLACLERTFRDPPLAGLVRWRRPRGGFFLVVSLPFAFGQDELVRCARDYGVLCCPLSMFSLAGGHEHQLRLSFSYVDGDQIERGVAGLGCFVRDVIAGAS